MDGGEGNQRHGDDVCAGWAELKFGEDLRMQSPSVIEAGDEVLQVLEVCDTAEEAKEVIITTTDHSNAGSLPAACFGPANKPSQVRRNGPTG